MTEVEATDAVSEQGEVETEDWVKWLKENMDRATEQEPEPTVSIPVLPSVPLEGVPTTNPIVPVDVTTTTVDTSTPLNIKVEAETKDHDKEEGENELMLNIPSDTITGKENHSIVESIKQSDAVQEEQSAAVVDTATVGELQVDESKSTGLNEAQPEVTKKVDGLPIAQSSPNEITSAVASVKDEQANVKDEQASVKDEQANVKDEKASVKDEQVPALKPDAPAKDGDIEADAPKPEPAKPKVKKKFVPKAQPKCVHCGKSVYQMDQTMDSKESLFHKSCLRCQVCKTDLSFKQPVSDPEILTIAGNQYRVVDDGDSKKLLCRIHATMTKGEKVRGKRGSTVAKDEFELKLVESIVATQNTEIREEMEIMMGDMTPVCGRCGGPLVDTDNLAVAGMEKFHKVCPSEEEIARFQVSTRHYVKRVPERVVLLLKPDPLSTGQTYLLMLDDESKRIALLTKKKDPCSLQFVPDVDARTSTTKQLSLSGNGLSTLCTTVKEFGEFQTVHPVSGDSFTPSRTVRICCKGDRKLRLVSPAPVAVKSSKTKKKIDKNKQEVPKETVLELVPSTFTLLHNGELEMNVDDDLVQTAISNAEQEAISAAKNGKKAKAKALSALSDELVSGSIRDETTASLHVVTEWSDANFTYLWMYNGEEVEEDTPGAKAMCWLSCTINELSSSSQTESQEIDTTKSQPPTRKKKSRTSLNPKAAKEIEEHIKALRSWEMQVILDASIGRIWERRVEELLQPAKSDPNQIKLVSFGLEKGVLRTVEADFAIDEAKGTAKLCGMRLFLEVYMPPIVVDEKRVEDQPFTAASLLEQDKPEPTEETPKKDDAFLVTTLQQVVRTMSSEEDQPTTSIKDSEHVPSKSKKGNKKGKAKQKEAKKDKKKGGGCMIQ